MNAQRRRHVDEADVVRVLTFACVIAVHTVHYTNSDQGVGANGVEMILHFTREAFFCLTGFVLVHQSLGRPLRVPAFWRKRFVAVGVPYVAWSVIYEFVKQHESVSATLRHLPADLALGTAWYHLYFLLVSMQIYLVFPVILWLVKRTAGHHTALLTFSAAIQLAVLAVLAYTPPRSGWAEHVAYNADALLPTYQFYVLVGAVAAFHLDRTVDFVRSHRSQIAVCAALVAAATEAFYLVAVHLGKAPETAAAVLQPAMVPWSLAAVALLLALGTVWNERRRPGSGADRALNVASDRSFGIFLVHPLILWFLLQVNSRWVHVPLGPALAVGAYLLVVAGSVAFAEMARHTYFSLALTGRRRIQPATKTTPAQKRGELHVLNDTHPARTPEQAPVQGRDDGDRRRSADSLLR